MIRPAGTGGSNRARVTVRTNPGNQSVSLSLRSTPNVGGHIDSTHVGTRPSGRVAATQGTTDNSGTFQTTYTASVFNGRIEITASSGGLSATAVVNVSVEGLEELGPGVYYRRIGEDGYHPSNHWGTPAANGGLREIAIDYANRFFGQVPPDEDKIAYNDQSLSLGGKFDLGTPPRWSQANAEHSEHRVGINCDVRSNNIPNDRREELNRFFTFRGSTRTLDETTKPRPHWHLRFEFGQVQARAERNIGSIVPEAWWGALDREPSDGEWQYWKDRLVIAQSQGQWQTLNEAKAYMRSLFYSGEYINRSQSDENYVTDLYVTYLLREPDSEGYNFWLQVLYSDNAQGLDGRGHLLRGFEESGEFAEIVNGLVMESSPGACDRFQEQNCYDSGGSWDSSNCSCSYIQEPPPDPCWNGSMFICE